MTSDEALEYSRMVKAIDMAVRSIPESLWPLCGLAVGILQHVERFERYTCPMCKSVINSHPCHCPVSGAMKGLRARAKRMQACP